MDTRSTDSGYGYCGGSVGEGMIAVVAGNKRQFDNFVRSKSLSKDQRSYKYIPIIEYAYGIHFTDIIVVGTYWESDVYKNHMDRLWAQVRNDEVQS